MMGEPILIAGLQTGENTPPNFCLNLTDCEGLLVIDAEALLNNLDQVLAWANEVRAMRQRERALFENIEF